jgi:hypothetical protein
VAPRARRENAATSAARAFRAGANLASDRALGRRTWEEFLDERIG